MSYLGLLQQLAPEAILVVAALAVLAVDILGMREEPVYNRFWVAISVAGLGCVAAACWMVAHAASGSVPGMFLNDALTRLVKGALLGLALCAAISALEGTFTTHVGEFIALILMATVGMMLL